LELREVRGNAELCDRSLRYITEYSDLLYILANSLDKIRGEKPSTLRSLPTYKRSRQVPNALE
jgi:hypothetical protein